MTNLKRVFLVMVITILLGTTIAFASDTIVITGEEENNTTNTSTTIGGENTTNIANTNTSTYNATNTNGNLPQTGEYDHIYVLVIGAFAISAIYAYKKITDYKNI